VSVDGYLRACRRVCRICIQACLLSLVLPLTAAALEPMSESGMDAVHAQAGIAIGADNVGVYNAISEFSWEDTTGTDSKIVFVNSESVVLMDTDHPLIIKTLQSVNDIPLVGIELLSPDNTPAFRKFLQSNVETFSFVGADLGSLHLSFRRDGADIGFMEEFALYAAPLEPFNLDGYTGDGIAFQFEHRTGINEFLWDYNKEEADEFYLRGIQLFGAFDGAGDPEGRFLVGNLSPYNDDSDIDPATLQVLSDAEGGFVRLNLPMEGSARIDEIGMYTHDDATGDYVAPVGDGFGPMIIDDMQVHHFQLDFRP